MLNRSGRCRTSHTKNLPPEWELRSEIPRNASEPAGSSPGPRSFGVSRFTKGPTRRLRAKRVGKRSRRDDSSRGYQRRFPLEKQGTANRRGGPRITRSNEVQCRACLLPRITRFDHWRMCSESLRIDASEVPPTSEIKIVESPNVLFLRTRSISPVSTTHGEASPLVPNSMDDAIAPGFSGAPYRVIQWLSEVISFGYHREQKKPCKPNPGEFSQKNPRSNISHTITKDSIRGWPNVRKPILARILFDDGSLNASNG